MLKAPVRFYPGMTHVKAMLADGWVCFGSANFNTLSLRLNQEADLATSDAGFAARFRHALFETDFEKAYELKEPASVGWTDHLAGSILNQLLRRELIVLERIGDNHKDVQYSTTELDHLLRSSDIKRFICQLFSFFGFFLSVFVFFFADKFMRIEQGFF